MNAAGRLHLARAADHCVKWLKSQGIKVMRVEGEPDMPRVIVKHNAMCDRFEEIVRAYERGERGERRCAWVFRFGCQIKWAEKGGSV